MDYMFRIAELTGAKQTEAMRLFKELREEFAHYNPNYAKMDRLEYKLDQLLNN